MSVPGEDRKNMKKKKNNISDVQISQTQGSHEAKYGGNKCNNYGGAEAPL